MQTFVQVIYCRRIIATLTPQACAHYNLQANNFVMIHVKQLGHLRSASLAVALLYVLAGADCDASTQQLEAMLQCDKLLA